jgi:hypothetical protein
MEEQEHSCLLRRLTLCDGQSAAQPPPRMDDAPCYCLGVARALAAELEEEASEMRTARARVVARADEVERTRRWRQFRVGDF